MYSHGVCFMPLTLNLSVQMGSAQIYKNSNKKKKKRQLQLSQRSSQKQQKLKNGSQVQSSKRRGDNKQERRWMARKCKRERERQKELEGRFSSRSPGHVLIMTRLLPGRPQVSTANLKAQGQTERPGRAWKTAVSQGARGEEGCSREDQHGRPKT